MVKGLDIFKAHFGKFADKYALIGGAACYLAMDEAGLDFRATKDLDIILCVEVLDAEFVKSFWEFIRAGRYKNRQKSTGKELFYRFYDPEDHSYPVMLELFSRKPDVLSHIKDIRLTPIPVADAVSSLSAILLDDDYYNFVRSGKIEIDGLSVIAPLYLIPLKIRAWIDLSRRKEAGEDIDSQDIRKHKNDVFRLFSIIPQDASVKTPTPIKSDVLNFIDKVASDGQVDLKSLGLKNITLQEILAVLGRIYR